MIDRYLIKNLFGINGLNIAWYGVIVNAGRKLTMSAGR
jgi:phosphatidylglycerol:prolipoprotein diacylglycerol transferase